MTKKTRAPKPKRTWKRRIGLAALASLGVVAGLGAASHAFPSFGAALADGVRAVVGPGPVAWAEDVTYGIEDRIKRVVYKDAAPKQFWEEPPAAPVDEAPAQGPIASNAPVAPAFMPKPYETPQGGVAGKNDGQWIAIADTEAPNQPPIFYKSLVHPDKGRSYAAVAIVAIDLSRVGLNLVAGTIEPTSTTLTREQRPGLVPQSAFADLVAVFNGGFKAEHGHYGMMLGGTTLLPPRDIACTVGLYKDGSLKIRTYTELKASEGDMSAYRQTPPCLVEEGKINDRLLAADNSKGWGAAVGGDTVIRRSAIGLDADGKTLFYGLGDSVTAGALARAMKAAGAENAAQLDVNAAYPRFLFYKHPAGQALPLAESAIIPDVKFVRHEYVGTEPETRDFFYLARKHGAS